MPIAVSLDSPSTFSWLTTAYLLGSTTSQAFSGHLVDIFGRRKGLVLCYGLFALGTLLCGIAPNIACFLAGRVMQGVGGGSVCSITAVVETDLIPMHRRPLIEGMANVAYGVVLALGGIYGAGVYETIGWKWAFLIQVPILVVDGAAVFTVVKVSDEKRIKSGRTEIDFLGMTTLLASIVLFQYGLNYGSTTLAWEAASVIAPLCVAVACFGVFVYWESSRALNPVISIRAFTGRTVGCIQISAFLATGAFVSCLFYISIYLEMLAMGSIETGLRLIPLAIVFALSSIAVGYVVQILRRFYHVNIALQSISAVSYGLLCLLNTKTPSWQVFVFLGILGIGVGGSYVTNLMGVLTSVPEEEQATVQAASWSVRAMGIAVSLTIASVIFQTGSRSHLKSSLQDPSLVDQFSNIIAIDAAQLSSLSASIRQAVLDAHMSALHAVFYFLLAEALVSLLVSVFIKDNVIKHDQSAD
ncbi:MAG: hypothetical protein M1818_002496 [Claussenomyces sp. TS43310]|nr:MAG: hypothetical protein M1818_002496 [Claussenomyces sp. TS43310]